MFQLSKQEILKIVHEDNHPPHKKGSISSTGHNTAPNLQYEVILIMHTIISSLISMVSKYHHHFTYIRRSVVSFENEVFLFPLYCLHATSQTAELEWKMKWNSVCVKQFKLHLVLFSCALCDKLSISVIVEVCIYKGNPYTEGQQWNDGCHKTCICESGKSNYVRCSERCSSYPQNTGCTMVPDKRDPLCCQVI